MATKTSREQFTFRSVFTFDFWRYLFKAGWLFFPALLFLIATYFAFWSLTQGKDLMAISLENRHTFLLFILALLFWAYVTWYTSRIVAKAREFQQPDPHPAWTALRVQGPRILAFTCFTLIILAFFQLPYPYLPRIKPWICTVLFFLSFPYYFLLYQQFRELTTRTFTKTEAKLRHLRRVRNVTYGVLVFLTLLIVLTKWSFGLIILLVFLQAGIILLMVVRREIIEAKNRSFHQQSAAYRDFSATGSVWNKLKKVVLDKEDRPYFRAFLIIGALAAVVYLCTVFSVTFAVLIGSFPFVLIAFGVLLILGNAVATLSVLTRFNFHIVFVAVALLMGSLFEPHYSKLPKKQNAQALFGQRQTLKEYFSNWVNDSTRHQLLQDPSVQTFPVYFVLANGGASRSGYWAASVLSKLQDTTNGKFSQHLFCLSGASGGSVGNAAFFSLLRSGQRLGEYDNAQDRYTKASRQYLATDFLTFTLARMLGPDVFRYIFPLPHTYDRAAALTHALEQAPPRSDFLFDSLAVPFSRLVTQKNNPNYGLPVLFVNTTRMQDGNPGVISNITVNNDTFFNRRIDVLSFLEEDKDIKLSSAVVLGASFPYVCPAGRIDYRRKDTNITEPQYFVDGGYFDNSGAGIVHEMIIGLNKLMNDSTDSSLYPLRSKLKFYVLHITNDPVGIPVLRKVHPLTNDLTAPIKTLAGSYGTQTSVNDLRLKNYMRDLYRDPAHYINLNLYRDPKDKKYPEDSVTYSMNWVISDYLLKNMNSRLQHNDALNALIQKMNSGLK